MEIAAYILSALNFVVGISAGIMIKVMVGRADAKSSIIKAFRKDYIDFGNIAAAGFPAGFPVSGLESGGILDFNVQGVEEAAKQIQKLHWCSILDIIKLNRIEWIFKWVSRPVFIIMVIAIISALYGAHGIDEKTIIQKLFIIGIPGISFLVEVVFLLWIINTGNYLVSVKNKYENSEY